MNASPLRRRTRALRLAVLSALLASIPPASAADNSLWIATKGNWSVNTNWNSEVNGVTNLHVVPGPGFEVALTPDADVTLDVNANVLDVLGYATTFLTVNPGQSLTATGQTGILVGTLFAGNFAGGATTIIATAIGVQTNLDVVNSTLTSPSISTSDQAFVVDSSLSMLSATGFVHISNSAINNNSALPLFSNLSIVDKTFSSDVIGSFFNGSLLIDQGASLVVDQASTITTPSSNAPYSLLLNSGALTLKNHSILNVNLVAPQMGQGLNPFTFTIDNSTLNLNGLDFTISGVGNSTLTLKNGATYHANGTSRLVVGPFSALGLFNGISTVNVSSSSSMNLTDLLVSGATGSTLTSIVTSMDPGTTLTASGLIRTTGGAVNIESEAVATAAQMIDIQYGQLSLDTGGSLTSPGPLLIGFNGSGSLGIHAAGFLSSGQAVISHRAGSSGIATITGQGSLLQTSDLTVGMLGTGTLSVESGATVDSNAAIIADQAASSGKATVSGNGSAWHVSGPLTVANQSTSNGELNIQSQALVDVKNASAIIANSPNTLGNVSVSSGGKWTIDQDLTIGKGGTGQLSIGGLAPGGINSEVDNLGATIASDAGSNGAVSVTIGGIWKNTNTLIIADRGNGQLGIDLGARASTGAAVNIANSGGSTGSLTVDGTFNIASDLSVGKAGSGTMTVENGGAVAGAGGHIGQAPGAVGNATVTGSSAQSNSSLSLANSLFVGEGGTGTLTLSSKGQLSSTTASIGDQTGAIGDATVTDSGTAWSNPGPLTVGNAGTGNLAIQQAAIVTTGPVIVGALSGGVGTITLSDQDSQLISTGTITIGTAGQGTVKVTAGAKITANTVIVGPQGALGGDGGTIVATIINAGGTMRPGDAPGTLHLTGDFQQNAGTLLFEIDGTAPGQFDQLLVSGNTTLSGGHIELDFLNFIPQPGEQFPLLQSAALTDNNLPILVTGLPPTLTFLPTFTPTGLTITLAPVPEPATALLLGAALASLLQRRYRTRGVVQIPFQFSS